MYASVTIDVVTNYVNDTYDYHIPDELASFVGIGSRVLVDFGVRKVMGYVLELKEETDFKGVIKDINEVLDYSNELTIEQIEMAKKISYDTKCPLIRALDVMLPSFLKSKYRKFISVKNFDELDPNIALLFSNKKKLCLTSELIKEYPKIKKEIDRGNLQLEYDVFTYGKKKYVKYYQVNYSCANVYELYTGMRRKIIDFILSKNEASLDEIKAVTNCSNYLLTSLVKEEVLIQKDILYYPVKAKDKSLLKKIDFSFDKQIIKDKYDSMSGSNNSFAIKPFLFCSDDEDFSQELYLDICRDNILNDKTTVIITPTLIIDYNIFHYLKRNLEGFDVLNFSGDMSNGEFYDNYMRLKSGEADVIVCTKVGVFLPYTNVGTFIVIDESNFNYISEMTPKYNSIEMIKFRGEKHRAKVILSSNPLTVENYYSYYKAEYNILKYTSNNTSNVSVVNMYDEINEDRGIISRKLEGEMRMALKQNKQAMLILNAKGYSNHLICRSCGKVAICDKCHIPLTYYKDKEEVRCRYCGKRLESLRCNCGNDDYSMFGMGLEMVKEKLLEIFPLLRILLIDSNTLKDFEDYQNAVVRIESGDVDVILGTNNIISLSNYSSVSLIGFVSIDNLLNNNDYRASYNTFSLICNAIKKGTVVIQGYNTDHYAIKYGIKGDFTSFYDEEIKMRETFNYPPFNEINKLLITGEYKNMYYCANYFKKAFASVVGRTSSDNLVLGPTYNKMKKGVQLILKHNDFPKVSKLIDEVTKKFEDKGVVLSFERYPRSF